MLNCFRRSLLPLTLGAIALATGACGRISILPPAPAAPPAAQFAPMPTELGAAVAAARAALSDPDPVLLYAAAYGVEPSGKLADSHRSGWVVGFQERRATGVRTAMVTIDWTSHARVTTARPLPGALPPKLDPARLPALRQSLLWARDAGLQKAKTFQVAFVATPAGPVAAIGERDDALTAALDEEGARQVILLDALTGKPLAQLTEPEPAAAPADADDASEDAASLAMLALSPRRGF